MPEDIVDVLIIGAGASSAAAAWSLSDTKMRIVCLEQGDWMNPADYPSTKKNWQILRDTEAGLQTGTPSVTIEDRKEAIRQAIFDAKERDIVLIAGKGHETYQEFADGKIDFDDRLVAQHAINDLRNERAKES